MNKPKKKKKKVRYQDQTKAKAKALRDRLVLDMQSTLHENDVDVNKSYPTPSLIWNLFNGEYDFSYNILAELLKLLEEENSK